MDIGIGHVITANGVVINALWDTFNPNLALGEKHEIVIFEEDIELKDIFTKLDDCLVKEQFVGKFSLSSRRDTIETYTANYQIELATDAANVRVKNFVFLSDGRPWAICRLADFIDVKPSITTVFAFESSIVVNNKLDIASNPWTEKVDKFSIQYAAMVSAVDLDDGLVLASKSKDLYKAVTDEKIIKAINNQSVEVFPDFISVGNKIGIQVEAKTNDDVVGIKAIFIRILWNMGILIFINHVEWDGNKLENLTLVKGHKLKLLFGIDFKEIKNASTI